MVTCFFQKKLPRIYLPLIALATLLLLLGFGHCQKSLGQLFQTSSAEIYSVSPTIIALQIEPNTVTYAQQTPYQPSWFDRQERSRQDTWIVRGGRTLGTLISPNQNVLYPFDHYTPAAIDSQWLSQSTSYRLQSAGDTNYQRPLAPVAVYRKSKPVDVAQVNRQRRLWPLRHTFYLSLPKPLVAGQTYQIQFIGRAGQAPLTFAYQPDRQRSEAVHVSHIGFRPDDPRKLGFLSTWLGTGGNLSYTVGSPFHLIDERTNKTVFSGSISLGRRDDDIEDARGRTYTLTDVYQLDFSAFDQPGQYHLCVEGVGCSISFAIADDVWQSAFAVAAKGFYYQRSGIALQPPYSDRPRPRPFHPDDGLIVYQSTTPLMDSRNGLNAQGDDPDNFTRLVQGRTDGVVPHAWGGYFDAGDWDRRIQHLSIARAFLELLDQFPNQFENLALNVPESDNDLPDLIDEALWGLDFFRRLQTPDGGIRGGIESANHPKRGETSWQESLSVMAYAPGPWSSYVYAGVAARVARILQSYAPTKAVEYQQSALAAMAFAEKAYRQGIPAVDAVQAVVEADRALAALELYRLTAEERWHQRFLRAKTQVEQNPNTDYRINQPLQEIAFLYTQLSSNLADPLLQQTFRANLLREAEQAIQVGANTAFGWTKHHPMTPVGWGNGLGAPKVTTLLRAYELTKDNAYLEAAILGCQFSAGANPDNMTFTTGLGQRAPQHPLIKDQRILGQPPPPGITVYGPIDPVDFGDYWMFETLASVTVPSVQDWPAVETYFDVFTVPAINEFTVMQSMTDTAYAWGYLSARL